MKRYSKFLTIFVTFFIFITCTVSVNAQQTIKTISSVNEVPIPISEIEKRYEFIPQIGRENMTDTTPLKEEILYTVIAERLWAAEETNIPSDPESLLSSMLNFIEKIHLRDALYKYEIINKATFTDEEIRKGLLLNRKSINVNYLVCQTEEESIQLMNELNSGNEFKKLFASRTESEYQKEPLRIGFGDYDAKTENMLFKLSPGEYSQPIELQNAWYIFFIDKINLSAPDNSLDAIEHVKKVLASRESTTRYVQYYREFLGNKTAKTNGKLFRKLLNIVETIYQQKLKSYKTETKPADIVFDNRDIMRVETILGDSIVSAPFVELENKYVSLRETFREMVFDGFNVPVNDTISVAGYLNSSIKLFTEKEYLSDEAYRLGLQSDPDVRESIDMWRSFYLGNAYKQRFISELDESPEVIKNYLNEKSLSEHKYTLETSPEELNQDQLEKYRSFYENDKLIEKTIELAEKSDIKIDRDVLSNMKTTNINMITYRYFGFGGKLLAAPLAAPFAEWYRLWQKRKDKKVF